MCLGGELLSPHDFALESDFELPNLRRFVTKPHAKLWPNFNRKANLASQYNWSSIAKPQSNDILVAVRFRQQPGAITRLRMQDSPGREQPRGSLRQLGVDVARPLIGQRGCRVGF